MWLTLFMAQNSWDWSPKRVLAFTGLSPDWSTLRWHSSTTWFRHPVLFFLTSQELCLSIYIVHFLVFLHYWQRNRSPAVSLKRELKCCSTWALFLKFWGSKTSQNVYFYETYSDVKVINVDKPIYSTVLTCLILMHRTSLSPYSILNTTFGSNF